MTTGQMVLLVGLYLAALVAVAYLTRAKVRRIEGALAGGAVFGVVALLAVALGEARSWWRVPEANSSHFQLLLWLDVAVSCAPVYLVTWRVHAALADVGWRCVSSLRRSSARRATTASLQSSRLGWSSQQASRPFSPSPQSMPCWWLWAMQ